MFRNCLGWTMGEMRQNFGRIAAEYFGAKILTDEAHASLLRSVELRWRTVLEERDKAEVGNALLVDNSATRDVVERADTLRRTVDRSDRWLVARPGSLNRPWRHQSMDGSPRPVATAGEGLTFAPPTPRSWRRPHRPDPAMTPEQAEIFVELVAIRHTVGQL